MRLGLTELQAALATGYGFSGCTVHAMAGGASNGCVRVDHDGRAYVATVFEAGGEDRAEFLAGVLVHLETNKFRTNRTVPTLDGRLTESVGASPVLVKTLVPGRISLRPETDAVGRIGETLARLHAVPRRLGLPTCAFAGLLLAPKIAASAIDPPFRGWLTRALAELRSDIPPDLPHGLCHGDLFLDNVVFDGDEPVIIDFEEASFGRMAADLGMALLGLCSRAGAVDHAAARAFLDGYRTVREPTAAELGALSDFAALAAVATAAWRWWERNLHRPRAPRARPPSEMVELSAAWRATDVAAIGGS